MTSFYQSMTGMSSERSQWSSSSIEQIFSNWSLPITPKVQKHLSKVYTLLAATCCSAAVGSYIHLMTHIGGMLTNLLSFVVLITLISGSSIGQPLSSNFSNRVLLLNLFGFLSGVGIGPLIEQALYVDESLIFTALFLTANIFVCLTLSALYLPRRTAFVGGAILSTCISALFWLSLLSMFWPSLLFFKVQLYAGLIVFAGYLVVDSQMMILRAESLTQSSMDSRESYVDDALHIFQDLLSMFVRLLIILIRNAQQAKEEERKKRRR